ncbi:uncharacterized protein LOC111071928 [Drosophila obscura]|uniref:uncharacterized protein LOC111071928 n=1 Tax=Drosophila obscura TaxID=7282 RepID=UPI001BB16C11|nr:uncharacterized protein LOC111071928 [Drosophila obscura]
MAENNNPSSLGEIIVVDLEETNTELDFDDIIVYDLEGSTSGSDLEEETNDLNMAENIIVYDVEENTSASDLEEETTSASLKEKSKSSQVEDKKDKAVGCKFNIGPGPSISVDVKFEDVHMSHDEKLLAIREGTAMLILMSNLTPLWVKLDIENTAFETETEILYCNAPYIHYYGQEGEPCRRATVIITHPEIAEELISFADQLWAGVPLLLYGQWL